MIGTLYGVSEWTNQVAKIRILIARAGTRADRVRDFRAELGAAEAPAEADRRHD